MSPGDCGERRRADELNARLVDALVAGGALASARVEAAFRAVLRHHFLPGTPLEEVYTGKGIVTHRGPDGMPTSSSSDPGVMAHMLEQLDVRPGHNVLEIGAGTGYNAALLAHLAGGTGRVTSVEVDPAVSGEAAANLRRAGIAGVTVLTGDGWAGAPSAGPFDRIVATVGVWDLSPAWIEQLRIGGVLVVPIWLRAGLQASVAFEKAEGGLRSRSVKPCAFMRLRGLGAGPERYTRIGRWTAHLDHPRPADVAILASLLEQPPAVHLPPALGAGWFTAVALTDPDAVMLADWDEKVTLSGVFDPVGGGLAVVESDCAGAEPAPRSLRAYGARGALIRLTRLIEETPAIDLDAVEVVVPRHPVPHAPRLLARLARPNADLLLRARGTNS